MKKPAAKKKKAATKKKKAATKKAKATAKAEAPKNDYELHGQKRDAPDETDPLRKFYASLRQQNPKSVMAEVWLMEHGLLEDAAGAGGRVQAVFEEQGESGAEACGEKDDRGEDGAEIGGEDGSGE